MNSVCLVQFAKLPELGRVKTRMQPFLSEIESLMLHKQLMWHTLTEFAKVTAVDFELWFDKDWTKKFNQDDFLKRISQQEIALNVQKGQDLGAKMAECFSRRLLDFECVIIMGSDCPYLNQSIIQSVVETLEDNDCVIVPAMDGGYALIALKKTDDQLFEDIQWGSSGVLAATEVVLKRLNFQYVCFNALGDIDEPEDLQLLAKTSIGRQLLSSNLLEKSLSK
jgi:rSAM/selenodomain-associated transferase 1